MKANNMYQHRSKEGRLNLDSMSARANQRLDSFKCFATQSSLRSGLPLSWKERQQKEKQEQKAKKIQNRFFAVEALLIVGILIKTLPLVLQHLSQ